MRELATPGEFLWGKMYVRRRSNNPDTICREGQTYCGCEVTCGRRKIQERFNVHPPGEYRRYQERGGLKDTGRATQKSREDTVA